MTNLIFSILLIVFMAFPANAEDVLLQDNCEVSPYDVGWWQIVTSSGTISRSSEQAASGTYSYKFYFAATEQNVGKRVELIPIPAYNIPIGTDYWTRWKMFVPSSFELPTSYGVWGQWHKAGYVNCPDLPSPYCCDCDNRCGNIGSAVAQPLIFYTAGTSAEPRLNVLVSGSDDYYMCEAPDDYKSYVYRGSHLSPVITKGRWVEIITHYVPRYLSAGLTQIWIDGVQWLNLSEENAHYDDVGAYLKIGFYAASTKSHTLYYDDIKVALNSSLAEMQSITSPDTTDPILSNVAPSGTAYASGTTSVNVTLNSDEAVNCRIDATLTAYADMSTAFDTTGGLAHSEAVGSLVDGGSYIRNIACVDAAGNESTAIASWTVDAAGGTDTNLLTASNMTSDSGNFTDGFESLRLFDGSTDGTIGVGGYTAAASAAAQFDTEHDLQQVYDFSTARIFGDAVGSWVSETWTIKHKLNIGDDWTTFVSESACLGSQWYEIDLSGTQGRFVRFEVNSPTTSATQAREIQLFGEIYEEPAGVSLRSGIRSASGGSPGAYASGGSAIEGP